MIQHIKIMIRTMQKRIYYIFSYFWVILSGQKAKSDGYLRNLKDKYTGRRCFIIGNGPSLTAEDLEKLKGEITFAANRIFQIFPQTEWRPTYYGMLDEGVACSKGVATEASKLNCEMKFFRMEGWYAYHKIKGSKCYLHSWWGKKYLKDPQFSLDLCKGVYTISTITYMMTQVAVWMGFKEIYFLGMDNRYAKAINKDGSITVNSGEKSYFTGSDATLQSAAAAVWEMDIAYEYLEQFSRTAGFRIYNATRGGCLEKFERVDFDGLFS